MKHKYFTCDCGESHCFYCGGGLLLCTVCEGAEGTLTSECCGRPITEVEETRIHKERTLDFIGGKWVIRVLPKTIAEAVSIVYKPLSKEFKLGFISEEKEETLAQFHSTMGRQIRNKFSLWYSNTPLEKDAGVTHADEISWKIMSALYDKIKKEST